MKYSQIDQNKVCPQCKGKLKRKSLKRSNWEPLDQPIVLTTCLHENCSIWFKRYYQPGSGELISTYIVSEDLNVMLWISHRKNRSVVKKIKISKDNHCRFKEQICEFDYQIPIDLSNGTKILHKLKTIITFQ